MGYRLKYILTKQSTNITLYTIERTQDGILRDVTIETLLKCINDVENIKLDMGNIKIPNEVKRISVNDFNNTGGKLVVGLNDLETYCLKNNLRDKLDSYNLGNNRLPANMISKSSGNNIKIKCKRCEYEQETKLNYYIGSYKNSCVRCATANGHGAPYCMPGINDLYTVCIKEGRQDLLNEYNDTMDIHKISAKSDMKLQ